MRIATWNVNSLKARLDKVGWWLGRARPDVLLLQETKLTDGDAPFSQFTEWGYTLYHHGEGRWNGVAIATRLPASDVIVHFDEPFRPAPPDGDESGDDQPLAEARMMAATIEGLRIVSIYAPNGRVVGSPYYEMKLTWFARLAAWIEANQNPPGPPIVLGGDFNVAPTDLDVWDPAACHGGTHVSPAERAAFDRLCALGLVDAYRQKHARGGRYSWWDYRAGNFHKNLGMRIDELLIAAPLVARLVAAEIDREARKGKPTPSDHAPVVIDLDLPGAPFDPGWKD